MQAKTSAYHSTTPLCFLSTEVQRSGVAPADGVEDGAEAGREALGILSAIVDEEVERHAAVGTEAQVTMLLFEVLGYSREIIVPSWLDKGSISTKYLPNPDKRAKRSSSAAIAF